MDSPSIGKRSAIRTSRQQSVALKYDVHVVLGFTIIGILLILILGKNGGGLWGYGVIGFALFGLLVFEMAYRTNIGKSTGFRAILNVLVHSGPILLLIICVGWLLALNVMFLISFLVLFFSILNSPAKPLIPLSIFISI